MDNPSNYSSDQDSDSFSAVKGSCSFTTFGLTANEKGILVYDDKGSAFSRENSANGVPQYNYPLQYATSVDTLGELPRITSNHHSLIRRKSMADHSYQEYDINPVNYTYQGQYIYDSSPEDKLDAIIEEDRSINPNHQHGLQNNTVQSGQPDEKIPPKVLPKPGSMRKRHAAENISTRTEIDGSSMSHQAASSFISSMEKKEEKQRRAPPPTPVNNENRQGSINNTAGQSVNFPPIAPKPVRIVASKSGPEVAPKPKRDGSNGKNYARPDAVSTHTDVNLGSKSSDPTLTAEMLPQVEAKSGENLPAVPTRKSSIPESLPSDNRVVLRNNSDASRNDRPMSTVLDGKVGVAKKNLLAHINQEEDVDETHEATINNNNSTVLYCLNYLERDSQSRNYLIKFNVIGKSFVYEKSMMIFYELQYFANRQKHSSRSKSFPKPSPDSLKNEEKIDYICTSYFALEKSSVENLSYKQRNARYTGSNNFLGVRLKAGEVLTCDQKILLFDDYNKTILKHETGITSAKSKYKTLVNINIMDLVADRYFFRISEGKMYIIDFENFYKLTDLEKNNLHFYKDNRGVDSIYSWQLKINERKKCFNIDVLVKAYIVNDFSLGKLFKVSSYKSRVKKKEIHYGSEKYSKFTQQEFTAEINLDYVPDDGNIEKNGEIFISKCKYDTMISSIQSVASKSLNGQKDNIQFEVSLQHGTNHITISRKVTPVIELENDTLILTNMIIGQNLDFVKYVECKESNSYYLEYPKSRVNSKEERKPNIPENGISFIQSTFVDDRGREIIKPEIYI